MKCWNLCPGTLFCYTSLMSKPRLAPAHGAPHPLRIGIDCRMFSSAFTGIGRYTFELVERFIKLNDALPAPHRIILFFNAPEFTNFSTTSGPLASPNVEKILVNARHYSLREQTVFNYKLYKQKLDLVHFPHFNVPILYRRPYVLTIHDLILSLYPGKKMNKWYHRLAYNLTIKNATHHAKKIIAVSHSTKKDLEKLMKIPAEKVQVIYNGISPIFRHLTASSDRDAIAQTLEKYKITGPFLLYTGVWRNHKNLVNLIKGFSEFPKIRNSESRNVNHSAQANVSPLLVLTGRPDPHYPEIPATIKKHHLENRIVMPGLVSEEELVHLYNAASLYVFPSLYEGFGLPPLEAMACGTAVAASNTSCIPEVCGEENALFFDPQDPADIAKKITQLYNDNDLKTKLSTRGLAYAKKFSWDTAAKETWKTLSANLPKPPTHV